MTKSLLTPEVDQQAIRALVNELKAADNGLLALFKSDLKDEFTPVAASIQAQLVQTSPLSGFNSNGRTKWTPHKIGVSVTPGAGWGRSFIAFYDNGGAGTKIVEFAGKGKRNYVKTSQGAALVRNLDSRASTPNREGRFFFQAYKRNRTNVYERTQRILDRYASIFNAKVGS